MKFRRGDKVRVFNVMSSDREDYLDKEGTVTVAGPDGYLVMFGGGCGGGGGFGGGFGTYRKVADFFWQDEELQLIEQGLDHVCEVYRKKYIEEDGIVITDVSRKSKRLAFLKGEQGKVIENVRGKFRLEFAKHLQEKAKDMDLKTVWWYGDELDLDRYSAKKIGRLAAIGD